MVLSSMTMSDICLGGANFTQPARPAQPHGFSPALLVEQPPAVSRAGLVHSFQRKVGGHVLTRSLVSITVLDVVEAVDRPGP
ncbi:Rrf2 family transcriptional regulator [Streptomyces sp. NPDC057565]|uniref:Rrf2 family transcriptional regulator n=1 Tax=Streptomyces sp. NPDC057565 TaxID=3346169 RepID=UPI0036D1AC2C